MHQQYFLKVIITCIILRSTLFITKTKKHVKKRILLQAVKFAILLRISIFVLSS